ncbi:MAG: DUF2125 domain-containing protein [Shimia sp.]
MRWIIWIVAVGLVAWLGYWFVGARALDRGAESWLAERRAEGWAADARDIRVAGFPYRFDLTLEDAAIADPRTGVAWLAPEFVVTALAYRPNHVIALFPERQTLSTPLEEITITAADMRASARVGAATNVPLRDTTAEMAEVALSSSSGWEVTLDRGLLALREAPEGANTYDLYFDAVNLRPNDALRLGIDPEGRLPDTFETLRLRADATFDAPWDRFAIERARPQPTRIAIEDLHATWGELELRAVGTLDVSPRGIPEGRITVKATNWREILEIGAATGLIQPGIAPTVERAMEVLAGLSGPPNTIDTPITFANGRMSLGPIPLGRAPTLRLR